jgi:hypothetical protein
LTIEHVSHEYILLVGQIANLREMQHDLARFADGFPWMYSPTARLLWCLQDDRLSRELTRRQRAIGELVTAQSSFASTGPKETFSSKHDVYRHCIDLWLHSSVLLHRVCAANGIRYFHFLQPNQYLPGSKPIGPEEAHHAIQEGSAIGEAVQYCFPLMRTESRRRLEQAGVDFTDLTAVFTDHHEPLYYDDCCHVTTAGNEIMVSAIAGRIKQSLAKSGGDLNAE